MTLPEDISLAELDGISDSTSNPGGVSFSTHNMFVLTDVDCGRVCLCYECHHGDDKGMCIHHSKSVLLISCDLIVPNSHVY